jgi:hypothetical protein
VSESRDVRGISSPGMLSTFQERRSWRCVGRRREEPAARRRATNGSFHRGVSFFPAREYLPLPRQIHEVSRLTSSCRGSARFTTWVTACDGSPCGMVTPQSHAHRLRHSSKPCKSTAQRRLIESEVHLLARPPMRKAKCAFPRYDEPRGLCRPTASPTGFRPDRGRKATRSHGAPQLQR